MKIVVFNQSRRAEQGEPPFIVESFLAGAGDAEAETEKKSGDRLYGREDLQGYYPYE